MSLVDITTGEIIERPSFADLEATIARTIGSFAECGAALHQMKVGRLYVDHGYETFEDYCRQRWGITRQHGNRLIAAAATYDALAAALEDTEPTGSVLPTVESQARPLTQVPAAERPDVWRAAVDAAGGLSPTAAQVQAAVDDHLGIDRGAGEADDREASGPVEPSVDSDTECADRAWNSPAPELAQHEDEGVADECPPPAAPSTAAADLIENDAEQALLAWRMSFTDKWKAITRLKMFAPADVAAKAEPEALDDLAGVIRNLNGWWAEIEELRRANRGLRVVNGGAR